MTDVIVTSNDNYLVDVDHDSSSTSNYFGVTHDNGSELFRVQENGYVGIGTTNPINKLDVKPANNKHLLVRDSADFSVADGIALQSVNDGESANKPFVIEGSNLIINANSGGRVGIGTTNPETLLDIDRDNADEYIRIGTDSHAYYMGIGVAASGDDKFALCYDRTNTAHRITVDTTGNVGIGTTSPGVKLDVNGNIKLSSTNPVIYLGTNYFIGVNNTSNNMDVEVNGTTTIRMLAGKVGINLGGNSPAEALELNGNINIASGALKINGNQVVMQRQAHIANPTAGSTIDDKARDAINSILIALETHGLLASS